MQPLAEPDVSPADMQNPHFDEDPAAFLQHSLSMASSDEEALQGLRHLRDHNQDVIQRSPPSVTRSRLTRPYIEMGEALRNIQR